MANLCNYNLYATGTKESLERFSQMMNETGPRPYVWNPAYCCELIKGPVEPVEGGLLCQHFGAATRWSVEGAMVDRPDSDGVVSLPSAAKMLGLHIHVESEEPDCCFAERITITPDGRYEAECTDLYEIFPDEVSDDGKPTRERFEDYIRTRFGKEATAGIDIDTAYARLLEGRLCIGGFDEAFALRKV